MSDWLGDELGITWRKGLKVFLKSFMLSKTPLSGNLTIAYGARFILAFHLPVSGTCFEITGTARAGRESLRKGFIIVRFLLAAFAAIVLLASPSFAHIRHFVETYEYGTPYKGEWEVEAHFGVGLHPRDGDQGFKSQIEIENGTTARWSNALYLNHVQEHGDHLKFDSIQYETRYRLAEPNRMFLNPALYFEYKMNQDDDERDEVEGKVILGKDWDNNHFAVNYVIENELKEGTAEHGYAIGWARETRFGSAGVEAYGNISGREHVVAPNVAFPVGARNWGVIALAFPLNGRSQPLTLRTLFEINW